jgi:hypothetical protein
MKKWLSILLSAGLLLYPFAGFAQDYGPQSSQGHQAPPVAQTLVREGDFAIKLAAELDLGNPPNEAAAEDLLARAGVSPLNGWISDHPMTPEIIGQIGDSIVAAAGQGKLRMTAGEATKGLYSLTAQMSLPTPLPVAQTLVREGDFAIKLAAELNLGTPPNEAAAEDLLARAGVSPLNGWLSDYPMTPEIIGQLGDSIAAAAGQGKLRMTAGEATKGLYNLTAQMNLPTPAGSGAGTAPKGQANPTVVNNYYYDQGPPVISYYPPPEDYWYLYDWVPFPAFWFGFWFPGFFIFHNFTTVVVVSNTAFVTRTAIVTNQIINPVTRTVTVVDPVVRTSTGTVQATTALRTGSGQLFRTASDMNRGVTMSGVSAVRTGTAVRGRAAGSGGFRTLEARKGAQAIFSRSLRRGPERTMTRSNGMRNTAPGRGGRSFNAPSRGSGGRSAAPSSPSRSFSRGMDWRGRM